MALPQLERLGVHVGQEGDSGVVAVPVVEEVEAAAMILTQDHLLPTVAGGMVTSLQMEDDLLKVGLLGSGLVLLEALLLDMGWDDDVQVVDRPREGQLGDSVVSMQAKAVREVAHHPSSRTHPAVLDLDRQNADSGCWVTVQTRQMTMPTISNTKCSF